MKRFDEGDSPWLICNKIDLWQKYALTISNIKDGIDTNCPMAQFDCKLVSDIVFVLTCCDIPMTYHLYLNNTRLEIHSLINFNQLPVTIIDVMQK